MKITVEVPVRAPVEVVWNAYTTPEGIVHWNAASDDWHTKKSSQTGGEFSSRMEAKDGGFGSDFAGAYTKVVPNQLPGYSFGDRVAKIEFAEVYDGVTVKGYFDADSASHIYAPVWQWVLPSRIRLLPIQERKLSRTGRNLAVRLICGKHYEISHSIEQQSGCKQYSITSRAMQKPRNSSLAANHLLLADDGHRVNR